MQTSTKEKLASQLRLLARKVARAKARQSAAPLREAHGIVQIMQHISDTALTPHEQQRYSDIIMGLEQAIKALPTGNQPSELAAICQLLDEIIAYTQKMLASERTKKLVMFLPYKASMWDSLESVWQAASKDENIETIVMPIPYADRNPDGTCAEWHYELHEYPEYVPVVDCRTIDLPSLHPDVIFFHNPYDNCNAVTSVDSVYYSDQLKKCCDLLVYIPYFVTGHTIAPHFCQAPGVVNADKVIVENEDIKAAYEANYPGGNPPKDKFLALGSPKYDAVLSRKREDYVLPEKWQKIVEGKKIVLYNTSLTAMLENSPYVCQKLRYVFSIFKDRKDAALWWRPHPLIKSTMRSMRPEILAEYEAIEQEYIKEGWGIYDDTPDMDRAIVCSDCYYGDASSMVQVYSATGKRVILQNITETNLRHNIGPIYEAWRDGDTLWFINEGSAVFLCNMDLASGYVRFVKELPIAYENQPEYLLIAKKRNKIICAPCLANTGFLEYNIDSGEISNIRGTQYIRGVNGIGKFSSVFDVDNSLYFIGYGNGIIVEYNGVTDTYTYHTEWATDIAEQLGIKSDIFTVPSFAQIDNKIYLGISHTNILIEIILPNMVPRIIRFEFEYSIESINSSGRKVWAVSQNSSDIAVWDKNNGSKRISMPIQPSLGTYHIPAAVDDGIILLPISSNYIYHIDQSQNKLKLLSYDLWEKCIMLCDVGRNVIFYHQKTHSMYLIDKTNFILKKIPYRTNFNKEQFSLTSSYYRNPIWQEDNLISIVDDMAFKRVAKCEKSNNFIGDDIMRKILRKEKP